MLRLPVAVVGLVPTLIGCASSGTAPVEFHGSTVSDEPEIGTEAPQAMLEGTLEQIGESVMGRPLGAQILGNGPRRVLWVGGIHGDEREGSHATAELPAAFLAEPGATARVTLLVLEDINPDGTAGGRRRNAHGVDLNRNFPADSFHSSRGHGQEALSEPEARALAELVTGWRPDLVLVCHSWRGQEFINFDGPARAEAKRFGELSGFEVRASDGFGPTPGSFGSWAGITLGLPVLTIEFRRGRLPEEAWEVTREAILEAVIGDLVPSP